MRVQTNFSTWLTVLAAMPLMICASAAVAQPLMLTVTPARPPAGDPAFGYAVNPATLPSSVTPMGYTQAGWLKVPADNLHAIGPRYAQPSGMKLRRGSPVPDSDHHGEDGKRLDSRPAIRGSLHLLHLARPEDRRDRSPIPQGDACDPLSPSPGARGRWPDGPHRRTAWRPA